MVLNYVGKDKSMIISFSDLTEELSDLIENNNHIEARIFLTRVLKNKELVDG